MSTGFSPLIIAACPCPPPICGILALDVTQRKGLAAWGPAAIQDLGEGAVIAIVGMVCLVTSQDLTSQECVNAGKSTARDLADNVLLGNAELSRNIDLRARGSSGLPVLVNFIYIYIYIYFKSWDWGQHRSAGADRADDLISRPCNQLSVPTAPNKVSGERGDRDRWLALSIPKRRQVRLCVGGFVFYFQNEQTRRGL